MQYTCKCSVCVTLNPRGVLRTAQQKNDHEIRDTQNLSTLARRGRTGIPGGRIHPVSNRVRPRGRFRGSSATNTHHGARTFGTSAETPSAGRSATPPSQFQDLDVLMDSDENGGPQHDDSPYVDLDQPPLAYRSVSPSPGSFDDTQMDTQMDQLLPGTPPSSRLGLYDDPDDHDDDYDLLAQLEAVEAQVEAPIASEDSQSESETEQRPEQLISNRDQARKVHTEAASASIVLPILEARVPASRVYMESHDTWFIRAIILLTAFLHTKHHVTFKACGILLFALRTIFIALGLIPREDDMPITLNTVIKRLDLQDRFTILPVCNKCHRLFPPTIPTNQKCTDCENNLFNSASQSLFQQILNRAPSDPPPLLAAAVAPLSSLLVDFLAQPGMEEAVESWRDDPPSPQGEFNRIMDGRFWKEVLDSTGKPFFDKESLGEEGEIRIGVNISLDWHVVCDILIWNSTYLTMPGSRRRNRPIAQVIQAG
jgi:hypothetical protein